MPTKSKMSQSESTSPTQKKKIPVIAIVGIGCLGLLVLLGIGFTIAGKVLFSKLGGSLAQKGIKNVIEKQTGVSIETDAEGNAVSMSDSKTGTEVSFGSDKMPTGFPSDFPLYTKAKPTGNISGSENGSTGFWLLMETDDSADVVNVFYEKGLKSSGWATDEKITVAQAVTYKVEKGQYDGAVVVTAPEKDQKKTTILIMLNPKAASDSEK